MFLGTPAARYLLWVFLYRCPMCSKNKTKEQKMTGSVIFRKRVSSGIQRKTTAFEKKEKSYAGRACPSALRFQNSRFKVGIRERIPEYRFSESNLQVFLDIH